MAAAVLLSLLLVRPFTQRTNAPVEAAVPQKLEDLIDTLRATSESQYDDLEAEIVTLTESLADSTSTAWREQALDQLGGELDNLVEEIGS